MNQPYLVKEIDKTASTRLDQVAVDAATGQVTAELRTGGRLTTAYRPSTTSQEPRHDHARTHPRQSPHGDRHQADLSADDAIAEASMQLLEPVIALPQDLSEKDRQALAELINQCAQEETDPERQLTAWETPETLGLLV
jgi:hypothetical protein